MSALKRNANGFVVRSHNYGTTSYSALAQELDLKKGETLYAVSVENGVRISRPVSGRQKEVTYKPGATFVAGPTITKAAGFAGRGGPQLAKAGGLPPALAKEVEELKAGGFGAVPPPEQTQWGWAIRMKGLILAGGVRTDAMILLPADYPAVSPIGFYLRQGAVKGALDQSHLYDTAYHGAPNLTKDGWQWFCGIADNWMPGRHSLLTYVACVFAMFTNEGLGK